jgi:hypothetical protein
MDPTTQFTTKSDPNVTSEMDPTTQFTTKSDPNVTSAWCEHADWFHVCQS